MPGKASQTGGAPRLKITEGHSVSSLGVSHVQRDYSDGG